MFDRLQKPFLTVETGEAYQPVRLSYTLTDPERLIQILNSLHCVQKNIMSAYSWTWYWQGECDGIHFESVDSFQKNSARPLRLGTITISEDKLFFNFPSFKRACLAIPFFYRVIQSDIASLEHADFINKVFAIDERLPHGFAELFKEEELNFIMNQRISDYHKVQEQCEQARTAEEAFHILANYTESEGKKRLPYAERYTFADCEGIDSEILFLSFYIFLRGRELVAIKRWFGQAGYSLADAADETMDKVFGHMGIDLLEVEG